MQKRISRRLVSVATLFVVLGTTTRAAAIDVSGDYVGFNLAPFTVSVVQAGTLLQVSGSVVFEAVPYPFFATGTVDPSTGAVSVTGAIQTLCADFAFSGTGDGEELTGTAIAHCVNGTQGPGGFLLTKCGNGVIDPLETCDPGSAGPTFRRGSFTFAPPLAFSPDGRRIAFTDLGPGPDGKDGVQIVTLDLATGSRRTLTRLPFAVPPDNFFDDYFVTCCPNFIDNETVLFQTFTDPDGSNPEHQFASFTVRIDGGKLTPVPTPLAAPGSQVIPSFRVTGPGAIVRLALPGTPVVPPGCGTGGNPHCDDFPITEIFRQDGRNLLQLTNLQREDTFPGFMNSGRTEAFFLSSADFGKNPYGNCQIFSIGAFGSGLRQVTRFLNKGIHQVVPGCFDYGGSWPPTNCGLAYGYYRVLFQDPVTHAIVFDSTCDPLDANLSGASQIFAIRPDGRRLHQLTDAAGFTANADGSVRAELPGPFAYSAALH